MSWGLALKFTELPFTTTTIYHLREKIDTTPESYKYTKMVIEIQFWALILNEMRDCCCC